MRIQMNPTEGYAKPKQNLAKTGWTKMTLRKMHRGAIWLSLLHTADKSIAKEWPCYDICDIYDIYDISDISDIYDISEMQ